HSGTNHQFDITIERPKPDVLQEVIDFLKKILDFCLCCVTCGCYRKQGETDGLDADEYGMILLDNERQAVQNLLQYLENESSGEPVLTKEHVRAMCILSYSDNAELQRSAALCFTEVSERTKAPLTGEQARPLVELLRSHDSQVQKSATLAISNFALKGPDSNKDILVKCGVLDPLIELLYSRNLEVQCNTCGCITALATTDAIKQSIVSDHGVKPLLKLMKSSDLRVQRNASGAILNLTHIQSNRNELVLHGAIPVLVELIHSPDSDVQYYSAAALSNLAVNDKHRTMMVKCQACFALRNLACEEETQSLIVSYGSLPFLHDIINTSKHETLAAAVACVRNLSILRSNEGAVVSENLVPTLCQILCDSSNPEAQKHAAGTVRNLAVGDYVRVLIENDCVEALTFVLLDMESKMPVLLEVTAALAVLADEDDVKHKLLQLHGGKSFNKLVRLASLSTNTEIQYNCAGTIGQISLIEIPQTIKEANIKGIVLYIDMFLKSPQPSFVHIALWTLNQILKDALFLKAFQEQSIDSVINDLQASPTTTTIEELTFSVLQKLNGEMNSSNSSDD
ncbi:hypothetical protein FSP39_000370, partial [Pinctada imbricata]